ncbi:hypothetical protein NUACC21_63210 [Scytonema sp. NUACC21]
MGTTPQYNFISYHCKYTTKKLSAKNRNPLKIFVAREMKLMSQSIEDRVRWTTADIELLPDNGNRYEIIDGELFVTRAPHWRHQKVIGSVFTVLDDWSEQNNDQ